MARKAPKPDVRDPFPEAVRLALRFGRDPCPTARSRAQRLKWLLKRALRAEGLVCTGVGDDQGKPLPPVPDWLDPCKTEPAF